MPKVSCLMPTYRRYPENGYLVEEAVESFLRQTFTDAELIICNDEPAHTLKFKHPRVRVINETQRYASLGDKLNAMVGMAKGDILCRWDDDDISLPHRLEYSLARLVGGDSWEPSHMWYDDGFLHFMGVSGNASTMSIWTRNLFNEIGGYSSWLTPDEDQDFTTRIGGSRRVGTVRPENAFYIYRWATNSIHFSGGKNWKVIGNLPVKGGTFSIAPRWYRNHLSRVSRTISAKAVKTYTDVAGYFDYEKVYDRACSDAREGDTLVEVGCLYGRSLMYLAAKARLLGKRLRVVGADLGVDLDGDGQDFVNSKILIDNIRMSGTPTDLILADSTDAARYFADGSLFFVFLDACHRRDHLLSEIQAWWPKVQPGGYLAGHDYAHQSYPDVALTVDEFFGPGTQVKDTPSVWIKQKSG